MTDERFKTICRNREEVEKCDRLLAQKNNEAQLKLHFSAGMIDGTVSGWEKEIFCPDWLRKAIFEAVDAHKMELDEEYKEL